MCEVSSSSGRFYLFFKNLIPFFFFFKALKSIPLNNEVVSHIEKADLSNYSQLHNT